MHEAQPSATDAIVAVLETMSREYREVFMLLGDVLDQLERDVKRLDGEMAELRDEILKLSERSGTHGA